MDYQRIPLETPYMMITTITDMTISVVMMKFYNLLESSGKSLLAMYEYIIRFLHCV